LGRGGALRLDGERHVAKLTLGALAELEEQLGADSLTDLVARFEGDALRAATCWRWWWRGCAAGAGRAMPATSSPQRSRAA
jgi:hypothetical protein